MKIATPERVPAGPLLLDTDVATWLLIGAPQGHPFRPLLTGHPLGISFATYGELLAHSYRLTWGDTKRSDWRAKIQETFVVVPYSARVAELWAPLHIKASGHLQKGGANDLWIAATALAPDPPLPVVTNNIGDFYTIQRYCDLVIVHPNRFKPAP